MSQKRYKSTSAPFTGYANQIADVTSMDGVSRSSVADLMTDPAIESTRAVRTHGRETEVRFFPLYAIIMYQSAVRFGEAPTEKRAPSTYGTMFSECNAMTLIELNHQLYSEYNIYIKNEKANSAQPFSYTDERIRHGIRMGLRWKIGGVNRTGPDSRPELSRVADVRHIVTMLRGTEFCENVWGDAIYGQNACYLVLKMVPVKNQTKKFVMGNNKLAPITWESTINGTDQEYVPQYVAAHTHDPYTCPEAMYAFDITTPDGNGKLVTEIHYGIPFFIGRFEGTSADALRRLKDQRIVNMQTDIRIDDAQLIPRRLATRLQLFIN
jgi:hypothetical protein